MTAHTKRGTDFKGFERSRCVTQSKKMKTKRRLEFGYARYLSHYDNSEELS